MQLIFGKNIKKIRSVHSLSQQDFADIFDLKRGTLGAYEEGRSNPKLETVIKIANHFSIGIEELLIGELTVNKLLKFNERLTVENDPFKTIDFEGIPCVLAAAKLDFIKRYSVDLDLSSYPLIKLPFINVENRIAFLVDDLAMTGGAVELFPKDIVIGKKVDISKIENGSLVILLTKDELLLRNFQKEDETCTLKADHYGVADMSLSTKDIVKVWEAEHLFHYTIHSKEIPLENRLTSIEQTIASLKNKKTT
ncbi:helix-turn-helix transcriptional regulator [Flavobacterium antarcticum]|uniref:helix-turn-helix transcriptional regulator n=1 Tax=Flavobacterium antarcticum TaxID=271155 RepID=UPI0003B3F6E6|nr:helix-turn-helix transcriptional regulator [Flavobacterium antarcticum]